MVKRSKATSMLAKTSEKCLLVYMEQCVKYIELEVL